MKEYKVEFSQVNKKYAYVVVQAESEKQAIDKIKSSKFDLSDFDDNETFAQTQWFASSNESFFGWIKGIFR